MTRLARSVVGGGIYHVLNRGNGRMRLFHKYADYAAFVRVLHEGLARYPVDLLDWCLMPNHWHLVLRPRRGQSDALAGLMHWTGVTHVRRHHQHYQTRGGGHLYQGRFKSFPVQDDPHFLTVCRYVQSNPIRGDRPLVARAELWPWSSVGYDSERAPQLLPAEWPVDRPHNWLALVNQPLPEAELARLRTSVTRGRPFGHEQWVQRTAKRLGLLSTLRPIGRPRNAPPGNE